MSPLPRLAFLAALAAFATSPADARVLVTFQDTGSYSDPDLHGLSVRAELKAHLQRLGARYLPRDADLKITVLDVRLAGQFAWWRTPPSLRVMNESTWPTVTLRYTLSRGARTIDAREETIADQFYLNRSRTLSAGPLVYEKALLDDWFRERFANRPN